MDTAIVLPYRRGTRPFDHCEAYTKRKGLQTSVHLVRSIKQLSLPQSKQPSKGDTGNGFDKGLISGGSEAAIIWCGTVELKTRLEFQRFQGLLSYSMKRPENGGVRNHCLGTYSIYVAACLMLPCPPWFHHKGASSSLQPRSSRASQRQHWPQWYHRSW